MAVDYKSVALSAEMADELKMRLSPLAVVEGFSTGLDPMLTIGAGVAGGRNAIVITKPIDWPLAKDVLGLTARVYNPHVIQLISEANYAGATDSVADTLSPADILTIQAVITKRGCKVEWYQSAAGVAPTGAAAIAGNLKATFEADLYWNINSSQ
jgi:hypothetical protein